MASSASSSSFPNRPNRPPVPPPQSRRIPVTEREAAFNAIKANLKSCVDSQPDDVIGIFDEKNRQLIQYTPAEAAAYFAVEEFFARAHECDPNNIEPHYGIQAMEQVLKKGVSNAIKTDPSAMFQKIAMTGSQRLFELPLEHGIRMEPEKLRNLLRKTRDRIHKELNHSLEEGNPSAQRDAVSTSINSSAQEISPSAQPNWKVTLDDILSERLKGMDLTVRAYEKVRQFIAKLDAKVIQTRRKTAENPHVRKAVDILEEGRTRRFLNTRKFVWALKTKMNERRDRNYNHAREFIHLLQKKYEKNRASARQFIWLLRDMVSIKRANALLAEEAAETEAQPTPVSQSKSAKRKARQKLAKAQRNLALPIEAESSASQPSARTETGTSQARSRTAARKRNQRTIAETTGRQAVIRSSSISAAQGDSSSVATWSVSEPANLFTALAAMPEDTAENFALPAENNPILEKLHRIDWDAITEPLPPDVKVDLQEFKALMQERWDEAMRQSQVKDSGVVIYSSTSPRHQA